MNAEDEVPSSRGTVQTVVAGAAIDAAVRRLVYRFRGARPISDFYRSHHVCSSFLCGYFCCFDPIYRNGRHDVSRVVRHSGRSAPTTSVALPRRRRVGGTSFRFRDARRSRLERSARESRHPPRALFALPNRPADRIGRITFSRRTTSTSILVRPEPLRASFERLLPLRLSFPPRAAS